MMFRLFTEHPASVGETYGEHWRFATGTGFTLIGAGLACLAHGLMPFLFTTTGSRIVRSLAARLAGVQPRHAARRLAFHPATRPLAMTAGMERPAVGESLNSAGL
jgi:Family of unknown function (DUF6356)